jgi:hypothetical protein
MQSPVHEAVPSGAASRTGRRPGPRPRRRRQLAGVLVGVLVAGTTAVGGILAVAAPASAAVSVPPGCGQPSVSSDGHTLTERCNSGHGARYKILADACDSHHCVSFGSSIVRYGSTAKLTSGGYFTSTSVRVYWYTASGTTACAYSKPGGTVAWCDMAQSIVDWAHKRPSYDGTPTLNWYRSKTYRDDCSGLVSEAWHLKASPDPDTDLLAKPQYTTAVARKNLRAGDILDDIKGDHSNHHVVIFAGWNSGHHAGTTDGTFRVWSFGYGTFADDSGHHELHDSFKAGTQIAFKPQADYSARRYIHGAA